MKKILYVFVALALVSVTAGCTEKEEEKYLPQGGLSGDVKVVGDVVKVAPYEYYNAFRNPMKGLREYFGPGYDRKRAEYPYPYGTLIKEYMQWNMMENTASDGVDKVIEYSNHRWEGVEDINVKVIPRPYIVWMEAYEGGYEKNTYVDHPDDLNGWHWPSDIPREVRSDDNNTPSTGGYFDPSFKDRVAKLVEKLGAAWDNDPRVAYVEMGLIGEWGEHHDPNITTVWDPIHQSFHVENRTWIPGIEKVLGDAFTKAFKNKKVMVRYAYEFKDYDFGIYWDSWAIGEETDRGYNAMVERGDYWKDQVVGGEITWNWGDLKAGGCNSFESCVSHPVFRPRIIEQIRTLHCNHLGGVTWANFNDASFKPYASLVQKALGYRFKIKEFSYPTRIGVGQEFTVRLSVVNTGSSPFYYDWPVEVSLLDAETREKVWSKTMEGVRISEWMPGEKWNVATNRYDEPAKENIVEATFVLDANLDYGKYIISLAVLDPAGMLPSLRFAVMNYFNGGYHPMGYIGVGQHLDVYHMADTKFDDIQSDTSLKYVIEK